MTVQMGLMFNVVIFKLTWSVKFVFEQAEGSFALEWRDALLWLC